MNPLELFKNMQGVQNQFNAIQEKLKDVSVTGAAGGGIVKVTMNGQLEITNVSIDPVAVDPRDIPMLQDLIVAACHDATLRVREEIKEVVGPMVGGLNMPGFPFQ